MRSLPCRKQNNSDRGVSPVRNRKERRIWEKQRESRDHLCHVGIGWGKMDVGFARIEITAINAKQIGRMRKSLGKRKSREEKPD